MRHRKVRIDEVKEPEVRVTAHFDQETYEQFQSSIKEIGPIAPIICCEVDGQFVLVDGKHRLLEAKNSGQEVVDVVIIPGDMVDVLTKNIFLDHLRGKTPVSEMVNVIEALWKEYGLDSEKIAEKTGMTRDYVEKLQKVSGLTPYCREALDEGRIGVGHAVALTKVKDPVRQETILGQQELYHWSVKELSKYIDDVLAIVKEKEQAPVEQKERPPVKIKCFYCGGENDPSRVAFPPTCIECSSSLITAIAQARREVEAAPPPPEETAKPPEESQEPSKTIGGEG
jgi:ParB/RepB/Spo0J family partition protein